MLTLLLALFAAITAPATPRIDLVAPAAGAWTARYTLAAPASELHFARVPDDSRATGWIAPAGFEIVARPDAEIVRRRDGAPFREVTLAIPPAYRDLPKDYAPFAPFGDGGLLAHTGRFFACAGPCPDSPTFRMTLRTARGRAILLHGRRYAGAAEWTDRDDGTNLYVGPATPVATPELLAVLDAKLPAQVRDGLATVLPRLMRYDAARLGALAERPMLFASYDAAHRPGWGRQGGTLPGQVFTHFYGPNWAAEMAKPDFATDLAWHFAHEAAHLYQRGLQVRDPGGAWVHEGGAEALAALSLGATDPSAAPFIAARVAQARADCAKRLAGRSLAAAVDGGDFQAAYGCGLVVNMAVDRAARARGAGDGLWTVWTAYLRRAGGTRLPPLAVFRDAVAEVAGACVADAAVRAGPTTEAEIAACPAG